MIAFVTLLIAPYADAKRAMPKEVAPVTFKGITYRAILTPLGLVEAHRGSELQPVWTKQIYVTRYDIDLERDIQDVFITILKITEQGLVVSTEHGDYVLDLATLEVKPLKQYESVVPQKLLGEKPAVEELLQLFADSPILGTGSTQFVTRFEIFSSTSAQAFIGSDEDKYAYKILLAKKGGVWAIMSYEYVFIPTGEKRIDICQPPWTKKLISVLPPP